MEEEPPKYEEITLHNVNSCVQMTSENNDDSSGRSQVTIQTILPSYEDIYKEQITNTKHKIYITMFICFIILFFIAFSLIFGVIFGEAFLYLLPFIWTFIIITIIVILSLMKLEYKLISIFYISKLYAISFGVCLTVPLLVRQDIYGVTGYIIGLIIMIISIIVFLIPN